MVKPVIDFTRPVPSDLFEVEEQVLRFARWARASGAKTATDTSGLGRRYDASQDVEWLDSAVVRLRAQEAARAAYGVPAPILAGMGSDEALAISRAWQLLPAAPVDLGRVLTEHYLRDRSNFFAAARSCNVDASDWCSARDAALRLLRGHLRAYSQDPQHAASTWGRQAAAMRGFVRPQNVLTHSA
jgi:hypothetical protein